MSPELVQAVSGLGALGFAVIAVWAFATGRVRVGWLVDQREQQLIGERDEWRARSLATDERLDRIADAFEKVVGREAPR